MERDEDTRLVGERIQGEASGVLLSGSGSDVGTAGRSLLDFSGLQTAHADVDTADRSVQKEGFHLLDVRVETATRNTGDLFTDAAGLLCETATNDGVTGQRLLLADGTFSHRPAIIVRRCFLASGFF